MSEKTTGIIVDKEYPFMLKEEALERFERLTKDVLYLWVMAGLLWLVEVLRAFL
jgi:hypothetical protein